MWAWLSRGGLNEIHSHCSFIEAKSEGEQPGLFGWLHNHEGTGLLVLEPPSSNSLLYHATAHFRSMVPELLKSQHLICIFAQQEGEGQASSFKDTSRRQHETPAVAFTWPEFDMEPHAAQLPACSRLT